MDGSVQKMLEEMGRGVGQSLREHSGYDPEDPSYRKEVMGALYRGVFPGKTRPRMAQIPRRGKQKKRATAPSEPTEASTRTPVSYISQLPEDIRTAPLLLLQDSLVGVRDNNTISLFMEFRCDPRLFPYLVSTSRGDVVWVDERNVRGNQLRSGVSEGFDLGSLFRKIVREIAETGREAQWGNEHPLTKKGIKKAIEYVREYEMPEVVLMAPPDSPAFPKGLPSQFHEADVVPAGWVEKGCVIAVPRDRAFLGFVLGIKGSSYTAVLHNPSRGLSVASQWFQDESVAAKGDPEVGPHTGR